MGIQIVFFEEKKKEEKIWFVGLCLLLTQKMGVHVRYKIWSRYRSWHCKLGKGSLFKIKRSKKLSISMATRRLEEGKEWSHWPQIYKTLNTPKRPRSWELVWSLLLTFNINIRAFSGFFFFFFLLWISKPEATEKEDDPDQFLSQVRRPIKVFFCFFIFWLFLLVSDWFGVEQDEYFSWF